MVVSTIWLCQMPLFGTIYKFKHEAKYLPTVYENQTSTVRDFISVVVQIVLALTIFSQVSLH